MDTLRHRAQIVEHPVGRCPGLVEDAKRRLRFLVDEAARVLELDRDRDELLLHAVVERALDRAPFVVVGEEECAQRVHRNVSPLSGPGSQGVHHRARSRRQPSPGRRAPTSGRDGVTSYRRSRLDPLEVWDEEG